MSPERRERNRRRAQAELLELELRDLRKLSGKTQVEVAAALRTTQGQVSLAERRDDHLLSTLRRYVEALGGELDVVVRFGDRSIKLRGV
jgi:transcriptional regulator with XRE-family HTH domain